jgi:TatD DNase family protein
MLIDSHVNLHAPQFAEDQEAVIARGRQAGVERMLTICDRLSRFEAVHAIASQYEDIFASVGVHPHEAKDYSDLSATTLCELASRKRVVALGETGLDYHYDLSPRDLQRKVFARHIQAAQMTGLPLIVHTREADEDMAEILEHAYAQAPFRFLMHCYTSGAELAARAAALGAFFSVSGIATFRGAEDVRRVIAQFPSDRVLVETDCPYLAPAPFRGRRNEPAHLPLVLGKLAEIKGWTLQTAEAATEAAFFSLFDRAS